MTEFELIAKLTAQVPTNSMVVLGPGDDCAVLDLGVPDRDLLFKTDSLVEGIHYRRTASREQVGHKALARCLSDVAAMGGTPHAAVVTLGLPEHPDPGEVEAIYRGLSATARRYAVAIVGGETTRNFQHLFISVAVLGSAPKGKAVRRTGAQPGDALFVTGELGAANAGRHLEFEPRLEEGRWLAENFSLHGMLDLSDGLAGDLRHLLEPTGVGAELRAASIPISRAARRQARGESASKPPLLAALTDGEDYELLFCVAGNNAVPLLDAWKARFPEVALTCIGKIDSVPGIHIRDAEGVRAFELHGYEHFS